MVMKMNRRGIKRWLLSILAIMPMLVLACLYSWNVLSAFLASQSVQASSNFNVPLRCSMNGRQEYLIVLQARHQVRDRSKGTFFIDRSLDFGEPRIVCTDSKGREISTQSFSDMPLFPGNRLTFKLLAGVWLDSSGVQPITVTVSQLSPVLPDQKISVFPWGKNIQEYYSIGPLVARRNLRSGEQLKVGDFGTRTVGPIPTVEDLGGLRRAILDPAEASLPIIGLSNPAGLTCSRDITKWQVLSVSDFILPKLPSEIEASIRNRCQKNDVLGTDL